MRFHAARQGGAEHQKIRHGRKVSGVLICMSGSLSTGEGGRQEEAGGQGVPGGPLGNVTPRPCVSAADRGSVSGSRAAVVTDAHFKGHQVIQNRLH